MINKLYATPNGATPMFHVVRNLEVTFASNSAIINIGSYASQELYNIGSSPVWNTPLSIPITNIEQPILLSIESWLTQSQDSPLYGGTIVSDNSLTLEVIKDRKWSEIKTNRLSKEYSGFIYNGSKFDSDEASTRRIVGATTLASLAKTSGQPFSIDWTLADNTVITLDADSMVAVGEALGQYVSSIHAISRNLRDQIENATTEEEVALIHWPT